MDCFKVLGIEATEDKELIKKAYRKLLPTVHPEEDPEGFQRLRQAYEEALNYEKTDGEEDGSELGLWMAKVRALYEDFEKRLSIDEWEKLLEDDVCFAIDTAQEADKRLLDYLMDNYYIPHEVFHILEARFDWEERRKELCDVFPAGFIDYLISNAKYEDNFRYYAFKPEPGRDYETFISNYFYLLNNIYNQEDKERESVMEKTCLMGIEHPDFMVLRIRYALVAKEYDKAKEIAEAALKNYENDVRLMYAASQVELVLENFEAAEGFSERILKLEENHVGAKIVAADALYGFKRYEEALESYKKLSKELPYDNYLSDAIYNTYAEIAKICKEKLEKEPENDECRMLYLDAAINSYQYEDAEKEALCISGAKVNDYTYNLNMGKIYNGLENYEKSLKYYERALELFDTFCSGTKDDHADLIADRGLQWEKMEKYKTALTVYDEGLELYPDFDRLNYRKAAVLNQMERSKEALDLCEKALSIKETSNAYHYKAESLFMLGEYEDALRNCDLAMERIPYYATYKIKLDTFYELRDFQAIIELTEYLRNVRLDTAEVLIIESKALIELERYEDAKKTLTEVQDKEPDNKEAYYEMATVYWYEKEYQKSLATLLKAEGEVKDRRGYLYFLGNLYMRLNKLDEAEEVYTSLFAKAPDAHDYLNCRLGALYKKRGDDAKAIRFYKTAIKINPKHPYANGEIADIYEESGDYAKALEYNTLQLEIEPSDYFYIQRGILYGHMNEKEKELENYMRAYELNPNNSFANSNIGLCHMKEGRVEEAVKYYERAIELDFPYPDAHINIALCLSRLGRNAEAYRYLDSGLEKYPERHWLLLRKGQVYQVNEKRYDEAIEIFRRYAEVSGDRLGAYLEIGDCYHDKNDIRMAVVWYEKAAQEDKKSEDPYLRIGGLWYEEGNYRKALHFFKKAFGKNKESAKAFNRIGEAYAGLGKKAKAEEYFKKALALYIKEYEKALENNEVRACEYTHMADLYRKLGQREKAKEFFEKAFAIDAGYKYCYRMVCHEGYYSLGLLYEAEGDVESALSYLEKSQELWPQRETREAVERLKGR